jgi:hypothetical protein
MFAMPDPRPIYRQKAGEAFERLWIEYADRVTNVVFRMQPDAAEPLAGAAPPAIPTHSSTTTFHSSVPTFFKSVSQVDSNREPPRRDSNGSKGRLFRPRLDKPRACRSWLKRIWTEGYLWCQFELMPYLSAYSLLLLAVLFCGGLALSLWGLAGLPIWIAVILAPPTLIALAAAFLIVETVYRSWRWNGRRSILRLNVALMRQDGMSTTKQGAGLFRVGDWVTFPSGAHKAFTQIIGA